MICSDFSFDYFWNLSGLPIDAINRRSDGWAEVLTIDLPSMRKSVQKIYVKRQENFLYRSFSNPFQKKPTLYREYHHLSNLLKLNFIVPEPLFFEAKNSKGKIQAVLVIKNLDQFFSLEDFYKYKSKNIKKFLLIKAMAFEIQRFHSSGLRHACLYPKHIFIKFNLIESTISIAFIDLEKAKKSFFKWRGILRDLDQLNRRSIQASFKDRVTFYKYYFGIKKFNFIHKILFFYLAKKYK